jgi:hypothetical protein
MPGRPYAKADMRLAAKLTLCGLAAILGACSTRTPIEVVTASGISRGYAVTTAYTGTIYTTKSLYLTGSIGPPDCTGSFNGPLPGPAVTVEMGCQAHYGGIGTA